VEAFWVINIFTAAWLERKNNKLILKKKILNINQIFFFNFI
jgi:hypothetical protein